MKDIAHFAFLIIFFGPILFQFLIYAKCNRNNSQKGKLKFFFIALGMYLSGPVIHIIINNIYNSDCPSCGLVIIGTIMFSLIGMGLVVIVHVLDYFEILDL